ncbi:hypothetical protein F7Q92_04020 [Ideonella dechloratans]|uniref:Uncharacterized protein n=1 Tax=Ideonella dechloratans TaxID=36863 RepID=A0A643FG71_IDEDE|nr:hypothetical protein F7Q92_04020 [Ideonella dechloratans]
MSFSTNDHSAIQRHGSVVRASARLARMVLPLALAAGLVPMLSACGQRAPLLLPSPAAAASGTVSAPGSPGTAAARP